MRNRIIKYIAFIFFAIYSMNVFVPFLYMKIEKTNFVEAEREEIKLDDFEINLSVPEKKEENIYVGTFRLYDNSTKEIMVIDDRDFLIGSLAYQMSPNVPIEAQKAQTVAAYSYYSYIREQRKTEAYDVIWDSSTNYNYYSDEYLREAWMDSYDNNIAIITSVVDEVIGQKLYFENAVACSSFFPLSNGQTESSLNMWGEDIPYLISVASPYDALNSDFEKIYNYSPEKVQELLTKAWPQAKMDFSLPYEQWFTEIEYTIGATVLSINVCGYSVTGNEFRLALLLSSPTFNVEYVNDQFVIKSKGDGDGVGMSQTGAIYMAAEGADYSEILKWYFPGTVLISG